MTESGKLSDVQLADLWLNSDSLHTQPIKSGVGNDLDITERYHAAAGVYARIGACVQYTYFWIDWLVGLGLLELDKSAFTDQASRRQQHRHRDEGVLHAVGRGPDADRPVRD